MSVFSVIVSLPMVSFVGLLSVIVAHPILDLSLFYLTHELGQCLSAILFLFMSVEETAAKKNASYSPIHCLNYSLEFLTAPGS